MNIKLKVEKEFDVKTLTVSFPVDDWSDFTVDGIDDEMGVDVPCRVGDNWIIQIDVEKGIIINWVDGKTVSVYCKVRDEGTYTLRDAEMNVILEKDGYVPDCLCPKENGYGDYVLMDIRADGSIEDWEPNFERFTEQQDDDE